MENEDIQRNEASESANKPKKRFRILGIILLTASLTILYISNLMYVNDLLNQVHQLNKEYDQIVNSNELIKARIVDLESPDRIIPYAEKNLRMINPNKAPKRIY